MANDKDFLLKNAVEVGGPTKVTLGTVTSNDIDLATGNYFADTLASNTTYTLSNAGGVQSFQLEVTGGTIGYDIIGASYDSVSFSISAQDTNPHGIFFKPDGLKMYILGFDGDDINEYSLSTAWDITTASFVQSFSVSTQEATPLSFFFKPDGTKMYVTGYTGDDVNEYNLSTAWDVSTASFVQNFSVATQETVPEGLSFKSDGTKMYVLGSTSDSIHEYNLSTAWDVSTASYVQGFSVATQDTNPTDLFFKSDGLKFYIIGFNGDDINEYSLSTAWDVSTASYAQNFSFASEDTTPRDVFFKSDGTKMYMVGGTGDAVYQYTTSSTATITWPSSIEWAGGVAPSAPATGETDVFTLSTDDGGTSYVGVKTADNLS